MSAKTALTMAHPAVSANGQPNHALAAVPSANTALTIDSVLMMSHGIIGDMGFRPLGLAGTLAHFLFFGFRLISLMSPVTGFDEGRDARDEKRDAGDYLRWCHVHLLSLI